LAYVGKEKKGALGVEADRLIRWALRREEKKKGGEKGKRKGRMGE